MTTLDRLRQWEQAGLITGAQHGTLRALVSRERFSLYLELNALLYLGVLLVVAGLGWTFETYFTSLGDPFILAIFTLIWAGAFYYCFTHGAPYSPGEVESPNLAFDYVLYLGCLVLSAELAYIEFRFHLFQGAWDNYLLFTAAAFGLLAYRFDNRLVLSLALAAFAAWFGLKVSAFNFQTPEAFRASALAYTAIVTATGVALHRQGIKPHFLETYLHVAANIGFATLADSRDERSVGLVYLTALLLAAGSAIWFGVRFRRFAFVAYGILYGYAGISYKILAPVNDEKIVFAYFIVTGAAVISSLVVMARRAGRDD